MKLVVTLLILSLLSVPVTYSQGTETASQAFAKLSGPYFGLTPPGATPEMFAPGVVSRDGFFEHSAAVFSPDQREVYWSALDRSQGYYAIYFMELKDGSWTAPRVVPFLETNYSEKGPVFSPDGNELYFDLRDDIWGVERRGDGWSEPAMVTEVSDPVACERTVGVTESESIFFKRSNSADNINDIYVCRKTGDGYAKPERLARNFASGYMRLGGVCIAPDESYMILELQSDGRTCELFISYRMPDGSWSDEIDLGLGWGRFPQVSPDGKYIFYMRREGIFWVSAGIIEELKPAVLK